MKKVVLLLALITLVLPLSLRGEDEKQEQKKVYVKKAGNLSGRPFSEVEEDLPEAWWSAGVITIEFSTPEGTATVKASDMMGSTVASTTASTLSPIHLTIGYPDEVLTLSIRTSGGNIYQGYYIP